jgi:hypothetical protein
MKHGPNLRLPHWWRTKLAVVVTFVLLTGVADARGQSLPTNWQSRDIGAIGTPGNAYADFDRGVWYVNGAGEDIWGTSDAFHYAYTQLHGDGQITALVTGITNTHTFAKAGLMIRESLAPESRHVLVNLRPDGSHEFLTRLETAGRTIAGGHPAAGIPRLLALVRSGDRIEAFTSANIHNAWTSIGWASIGSLADTLYVGLAVTSHDQAALNTSTFEAVHARSALTTDLPHPWTTQTIGDTARGSTFYRLASNNFQVNGSGPDIWGTSDGFQYVSQPIDGDQEIIVRLTHIDNTHPYAKAGVMLRESLTASSAHVILDVKPDGGVEFMTRSDTGGPTLFVAGGTAAVPRIDGPDAAAVWLKLVRSGANVTGYTSEDGTVWSVVGSTETTIGRSAHIGMAVTSHDVSRMNAGVFDSAFIGRPASDEILVYAADAGNLYGGWTLSSDSTAAGGQGLTTPNSGYAVLDAPLTTPAMYFDAVFDAKADTPYTLWLRIRAAHNSKWSDSVWVQFSDALVDGSPTYRLNTTSALLVNLATDYTASSLNAWGWANGAYWLVQPATVTFGRTGPQSIRVQVREDGVNLDQIVLSSSRYIDRPPGPSTNDNTIVPEE